MDGSLILNSPHKNFEGIKKVDELGIEYWEARELMPLLGYSKWDNFDKIVIGKAKSACKNSDQAVKNHFADIGKMIKIWLLEEKLESPSRTLAEPHIKKLERWQRKQLKGTNKILK